MMVKSKQIFVISLLFIPVASASYYLHEFGHWLAGEILGNDMSIALNGVWPKDGQFKDKSHLLWVLMGGPFFTILQSLIFLLIIEKSRIIYFFPFVFFPFFMRLFAILFGGYTEQDEIKLSLMLDIQSYIIPIAVLFVLLLPLLRVIYKFKIEFKLIGLFSLISLLVTFIIIGA